MSTRNFDAGRLRWLLAAAVTVFALAGGLAACGDDDDDGGDSGSSEAKNVYLNAYAQEIPYFRDWQAGADGPGRGARLGRRRASSAT